MKILLIDDDPDILLIVAFTLQKYGGHTVIKAASGSEGFDKAKLHQPGAIILDFVLPDQTGVELLSQLQQLPELKHTKFIFLTGKSKPEEVAELLNTSVTAVITKPFQPQELAETVDSILAQ